MVTLIRGAGKFWIFLAFGILWSGISEAYGQGEPNGTQTAIADQNQTATANPAEADSLTGSDTDNGGLELVKKILTYPLIKMGDSSLTLQSLLILGIFSSREATRRGTKRSVGTRYAHSVLIVPRNGP